MTAEPRWRTLYLDLLKRSLTGAVHQDSYSLVRTGEKLVGMQTVDALSERGIELVQRRTGQDRTALVREGRGGWPLVGETMIGLRRLTSLQRCVDNVLDDDVPGDLIEAGVWRGGAGIFGSPVVLVEAFEA
jgi:O-methyltransferase